MEESSVMASIVQASKSVLLMDRSSGWRRQLLVGASRRFASQRFRRV